MESYKNYNILDLPNEIWKDIPGYIGYYQASNLGRIKSLTRSKLNNGTPQFSMARIMKQTTTIHNYLVICLVKERHYYQGGVHRLVCLAFHSNPENKKTVNHIDGNRLNNNESNLEWNTHSENLKHSFIYLGRKASIPYSKVGKPTVHPNSKSIQQLDLNNNLIKTWSSIADIERKLNLIRHHIINCCKNKYGYKTCGGFKWKYENK